MWEIAARSNPYLDVDPNSIRDRVLTQNLRPSMGLLPDTTAVSYTALMQRCWSESPSHRPDFAKVVEDLSNPSMEMSSDFDSSL